MHIAGSALIFGGFISVYLVVLGFYVAARRRSAHDRPVVRGGAELARRRRRPRAAQARTSGSSDSSAYLPFASSVPAKGYSPLKHASQCVSRETPTAS